MKVYKIILRIEQWIWQLNLLPYLYRMKIIFNDSSQVMEAESPFHLVTQMREKSHTVSTDNSDYMKQYARRVVIYSNQDIRATSEKEFFEDLLKLKHIQLMDK